MSEEGDGAVEEVVPRLVLELVGEEIPDCVGKVAEGLQDDTETIRFRRYRQCEFGFIIIKLAYGELADLVVECRTSV